MKKLITYRPYSSLNDSYEKVCRYHLTDKQFDFLRDIETKKKTINKGDTIFVSKSVTFPRFKIRAWGEDKKVKTVRKLSKNTTIVIDLKQIKSILNSFHKETFFKISSSKLKGIRVNSNGLTPEKFEDEEYVYFKDTYDLNSYIVQYRDDKKELFEGRYLSKHEQKVLLELDGLIRKKCLNFIDVDDFVKSVSSEMPTMTYENMMDLAEMISSNNDEVRNLGVEMITDYNFDTSKHYIGILLEAKGSEIYYSDILRKTNFGHIKRYFYEHTSSYKRRAKNFNNLKDDEGRINILRKYWEAYCKPEKIPAEIGEKFLLTSTSLILNYSGWGVSIKDGIFVLNDIIFDINEQQKSNSRS